jgi:hypothetical protein
MVFDTIEIGLFRVFNVKVAMVPVSPDNFLEHGENGFV